MSKEKLTALEQELIGLTLTLLDNDRPRKSFVELLAEGADWDMDPASAAEPEEVLRQAGFGSGADSSVDLREALSVERPDLPTVSVLQELLAAMELRENTGKLPAGFADTLAQAKAHRVKLVLLSRALDAVADAHETQSKRESEEFHLSPEAMHSIWHRAKNRAVMVLRGLRDTTLVEKKDNSPDLGRQLKGRADSLKTALQSFGVSLGHSQVLQAMARMYGFKGYHALRAALQTTHPAFCPHCGAAGSVTAIRPMRSAQAQRGLVSYRCSSCRGEFAVAVASAEQSPEG